ncbi:MAG: ACP S-malonyltransferase [Paludibacteraceae bacterium]|nr:ACP S-malonyltransferase [Paludibacteraceae bacterium]
MKAYVFPGQGAQFVGMGKDLYDASPLAHDLFEKANDILGFRITDLMFSGTDEDLRQTKVTQPAVFLHSVISCLVAMENGEPMPDMVAGHSLGEYSALVVAGALSFEDGLRLVSIRANAMQKACELQQSTMAAILRTEDQVVEDVCNAITDEVVVAANYNCPGQIIISGSMAGVEKAMAALTEKGVKRMMQLKVGGAFHSPLMQPAAEELEKGILEAIFTQPKCPIYQNVNALPQTDLNQIRQNLIAQLTSPVRWTQTVRNMIADGATQFVEYGPGKVLTGLIHKIDSEVEAVSTDKRED